MAFSARLRLGVTLSVYIGVGESDCFLEPYHWRFDPQHQNVISVQTGHVRATECAIEINRYQNEETSPRTNLSNLSVC